MKAVDLSNLVKTCSSLSPPTSSTTINLNVKSKENLYDKIAAALTSTFSYESANIIVTLSKNTSVSVAEQHIYFMETNPSDTQIKRSHLLFLRLNVSITIQASTTDYNTPATLKPVIFVKSPLLGFFISNSMKVSNVIFDFALIRDVTSMIAS
jgi:hypothetical protein